MPVQNAFIAEIFNKIADLLAIEGANQFKVRAYRNAAWTINGLTESLADMVKQGKDLTELSGIGDELAKKIQEIVKTSSLKYLKKLEMQIEPSLTDLLHINGLGPKRVNKIYHELNITTVEELKKAAKEHKIQALEGFGKKVEEKILDDLKDKTEEKNRKNLLQADDIAEPLFEYLNKNSAIEQITIAGSYRRHKETIGDLDILVTSEKPKEIIDYFVDYDQVKEVISRGTTKSTIILEADFQIDLRVVDKESYGSALLYFTGSKSHNIKLRSMAQDKKYKINEYGMFKDEDKREAGKREKEIYRLLNLEYIEAELREDRGEIQAAQNHTLPKLIKFDDIRGDLHSHTKYSDGKNTILEMAESARKRGYDYLAITEHSKSLAIANGINEDVLAKQINEIEKLNDTINNFLILKGIEVDILEDGSLDIDNSILKKLDLVVGSIHSKFNLSEKKQTERIIKAMDNKYFNILAHPTGRKIGMRKPYSLNIEKIMEAAKERHCFLEINANPIRLDLKDVYAKLAKEVGLKLTISTDAHSINELSYMKYGIWQARRGWLQKDDVINTKSWKSLKKILQR